MRAESSWPYRRPHSARASVAVAKRRLIDNESIYGMIAIVLFVGINPSAYPVDFRLVVKFRALHVYRPSSFPSFYVRGIPAPAGC
jgi:hypothetical protein